MLARLFIWWKGATLGALFDIKRRSVLVGEDEFGNRYFEERTSEERRKKLRIAGERIRRYVIFKGIAEPSKVPPDWHGWLHHTHELPPTEAPLKRQRWELSHQPNLTGTPLAWRPKGAIGADGARQKSAADYEAWTPDA
jgi:NADH:ubiquinone oxidoreductase subunit